jgi:hypothetical protein
LDKPTGPNIRVTLNSGIELHKEPFNLIFKSSEVVLELIDPTPDGGETVIRSTLYKLQ